MTPLKAVRAYCLWCNESALGVRECPSEGCPLYHLRTGHGSRAVLGAIRARCLDCASTATRVTRCSHPDCPLYIYRSGHRPKAAGFSTEAAPRAVSGTPGTP